MRDSGANGLAWFLGALIVVTVVAVADLAIGDDVVLINLVLIGPLVASMTISSRATAAVGIYALGWTLVNGVAEHNIDEKQELVRVITIVAASVLSVYAAREREQREAALHQIAHVAEVAQRAILRRPPPRLGPLAVAARYRSAAEAALIGGDFYETAFTLGEARVVVGDVRGKGLDAVRLAASVLGAFRESVFAEGGLLALARAVDARVTTEMREEDFVTVAFLEAPFHTGVSIVNCGHHPPLLIAADGALLLSPSVTTRPLGMQPDVVADSFPMSVGDRVLLYTDGLVEARDQTGAFFPFIEHADVLRGAELDECLGALLGRLLAHVGGHLEDDLALVLVERVAE